MLKSSGGGRGGGGVDEVQTSVVAGENRIGKWELERERLDQARDQRERVRSNSVGQCSPFCLEWNKRPHSADCHWPFQVPGS